MDKLEELKKRLQTLDESEDADEKLGSIAYAAAAEDDNTMLDIGQFIGFGLMKCETQRDFENFNRGVTAICGFGVETLISRMEKEVKGE